MAKGGRRQGAGRPRGAKDGSSTARAARLELTKQIAERAAAEGVMPLEVMITAMRQAWAEADRDKAVSYAEKAAPYLHAKLANVQHSGDADSPIHSKTRIEMVVIDAGYEDDKDARPAQAATSH